MGELFTTVGCAEQYCAARRPGSQPCVQKIHHAGTFARITIPARTAQTTCLSHAENVPTTPPMQTAAHPRRETPDQRQDRQAAYFREMAEMNMDGARISHAAMKRAHAAGQEVHKQILDLARATRSVVTAVNGENALFRKERAPRAPASDPRRTPLCATLLKAAKAEPDPALRSALVRDIPALVEETPRRRPRSRNPHRRTPLHPRRPPPPHPRPGLPPRRTPRHRTQDLHPRRLTPTRLASARSSALPLQHEAGEPR